MGFSPPSSFDQVRDQTLSRMKSNIELMVATNGGNKVVVIPHSMGVLYFLHFMKWVEAPAPMGGGGGSDWCAKHIKAVMNIGGPFLGVPKSVAGLFSIEARDIAVARFFSHHYKFECLVLYMFFFYPQFLLCLLTSRFWNVFYRLYICRKWLCNFCPF